MLNNVISAYAPTTPPTPVNSYESISTVTVGAGGASTVTFSSIPSTYKHLQIRAITRTTTGTFADMKFAFNSDTGSTYSWGRMIADGSTVAAGHSGSTTLTTIGLNTGSTQSAGVFAASVIDILDYGNTFKNKTIRSLTGADNNGSGYAIFYSGAWYNTAAAIDRIDITASSGTYAQYTQFALYGIKG